jgi:hypothetical protein
MCQEIDEQIASRKVHGPHVYGLADYGLSREGLKPMFRQYVDRFGIAEETE